MPIYHSKTWPASTMAMVQLKVDQQGRTFSAIAEVPNDPMKKFNGNKIELNNSLDLSDDIVMMNSPDKENLPQIPQENQYSLFNRNTCTYDCILPENDCDFMRCDCQFNSVHKNNANNLVCKYNEDNLRFINDAKQFLKNRIKKDKSIKRKKSESSNMTVSTVLRSNSCDSAIFHNLKLNSNNPSSSLLNSKICYCIQLLALSPNTLLRSVQLPSRFGDRRYSSTSMSSICKWTPNKISNGYRKGRSKSVSHMNADKPKVKTKSQFRRCNSTIEAAKRRPSEIIEDDYLNRCGNLAKTPLSARKTQTLYRHYYPEGGWGWTILVVCVVVSILDHGLQLAAAVLVTPAMEKFKVPAVHAAGESFYYLHTLYIKLNSTYYIEVTCNLSYTFLHIYAMGESFRNRRKVYINY